MVEIIIIALFFLGFIQVINDKERVEKRALQLQEALVQNQQKLQELKSQQLQDVLQDMLMQEQQKLQELKSRLEWWKSCSISTNSSNLKQVERLEESCAFKKKYIEGLEYNVKISTYE